MKAEIKVTLSPDETYKLETACCYVKSINLGGLTGAYEDQIELTPEGIRGLLAKFTKALDKAETEGDYSAINAGIKILNKARKLLGGVK